MPPREKTATTGGEPADGVLSRARAFALARGELLALALVLAGALLVSPRPPAGVYLLGIVAGAALILHAIGIVLVYRANRIINFAQVAVGAVAGTLFAGLVQFQTVPRLAQKVCPPCLEEITPAVSDANYVLSAGVALAVAVGLGWAIHAFVIRRFSEAPRLVLTVATIFLTQFLVAVQLLLPRVLDVDREPLGLLDTEALRPPIDVSLEFGSIVFGLPALLTVAAGFGATAMLVVYFRRSSTGIAIRASAENPSRAETLGVNVNAVTSRAWVISAGLSGVAGILVAMAGNAFGAEALPLNLLLRILAAAVIARFVSLPVAAAAALVIGLLDQAILWSSGNLALLDGLFLLLIGGVLMVQRHRASRAELEQASSWKAAREVRPVPASLRDVPEVKRWLRVGPLVGLGAIVFYPWAMSPGQTNIASVIMIYSIVALSLLVLTGWAGQISLGQFAFAAVGGYVAGAYHLPFFVTLVAAGVVGALVAVIVGLPALKLRGLHLAVMTLAFALATSRILLDPSNLGSRLRGVIERPSVLGMDFEDERVFYYVTLLALGLTVAAVVGMRRSRAARALIASRDNEQAAQSFGINLLRVRLMAFAVSGFMAASAGALFAYHQHAVNAEAFSANQSIQMFIMAVIGGLGSVASPLIGALYFGLLSTFSDSPMVVAFGVGGGGLLLMVVMPGGLGLLLYDLRDAWLRRVARRHGLVVPSLLADVRVDGTETAVAPILPKVRPSGGEVFVRNRYGLDGQWAVDPSSEVTRA